MTKSAVVEVRNIRYRYSDFTAVDGISFDVHRGQVLALLGTNGAGKTTTIDLLIGFRAPDEGTVRLFGVDPHEQRSSIAARIGVVLQEAGFFEGLTVAETVDAWRRFFPRAHSRADTLDLVDLADRARTTVGKLSGGERRRLDLALGLLGHPELIFLDEPTTGLDPQARRRVWALLRDLVAKGTTVILTTHYMEEAEFLADHVLIMERGRIAREGNMAEVIGGGVSQISFLKQENLDLADLPISVASTAHDRGDRLSITTNDPQRLLQELLTWANNKGLTLTGLEVTGGSLEDVFLGLASTEGNDR